MPVIAANTPTTLLLTSRQRLSITVAPNNSAVIEVQYGLSDKEGEQISVPAGKTEYSWPQPGALVLTATGGPIDYALSGGQGQAPQSASLPLSAGASAFENQYSKLVVFGNALTAAGSVKDFSTNGGDLVYAGGTTDAEVYNTLANYLSCLGGASPNNKALSLAAAKFQWDLQKGESLFVQACFQRAALTATADHVFGNCSGGSARGFLLAVTPAGALQLYTRAGLASGGVTLVGGSTPNVLAANTDLYVTMWIDGASKIFNGWVNGVAGSSNGNWTNKPITPDGNGDYTTVWSTPASLTLGTGGDTVVPTTRTAVECKFKAFRAAVIPPGVTLQNAAMLDWQFNRQPLRLLTINDLSLI